MADKLSAREIAERAKEKLDRPITGETAETVAAEPVATGATADGMKALADMLRPHLAPNLSEGRLKALVDDAVQRFTPKATEIVIQKEPEGERIELGIVHYMVALIIRLVRLQAFSPRGIWLIGPAGAGKTSACGAVAKALGLAFYPVSLGPQTSESKLVGYVDAYGKAVWTVIREAFTNGGLLLLDEIDASNAGVLTCLNALLANTVYTWPDGTVTMRHANFRFIAAANTYGTGANLEYIGRAQLDAATLDRFKLVEFGYDAEFEKALTINAAEACKPGSTALAVNWHNRIVTLRKAAEKAKVRIVISPRASIDGAVELADGFPQAEVEERQIWGYGRVKDDDRRSILSYA